MSKFKHYIKCIYYNVHRMLLHSFCKLYSKPLEINKMKKVLIISPHPDDEVFACAHLMHKLIQEKKEIDIIILSKGEAAHKECCPRDVYDVISHRKHLTINANKLIGIPKERIYFLDFPDGEFDSIINNINYHKKLDELIKYINPDCIFYPHPFECSPDHEAATKIINDILHNSNKKLFLYCVWVWYHMPIYKISQMNFRHSFYITSSKGNIKEQAINIYINNKARCGISYSGNLPKYFLKAFQWKKELFFTAN